MNERKATKQEGLRFTGTYGFNKVSVKTRIAEERKKYPKARIILVNSDGGGYSAYANDVYFAHKFIEQCEGIHLKHEAALRVLKENYDKNLELCRNSYISRIEKLNEALKLADFGYTVTPISEPS